MGTENLDKIFNPRRIAVIGASDKEKSLGAKLLRNLIGVGYKGVVYPVNPFRPTVQGITAYPNIKKIPRQVDLAIVATPAHTVPQIIDECGSCEVQGIVIVSAGFRETGEEGKGLEKHILRTKNEYNMRIIGPNSLGVMRPRSKLNATFANRPAIPGKIAFISQSAALCASVLDWASAAHIGFSSVVSVGSMLDVDFGDLIDYFGTDPQTTSIVLYIESIKNARKFMSAARGFARTKPIVVVKAGRFRESAEAALCHTGALCGNDAVYDAAFRRAGIVRVDAIEDLFNCAEALAMQPNPEGPRLTIITNAGGPGILATDFLISKGGRLSKLTEDTIQNLNDVLPSYCSSVNPIDILEESNTDRFSRAMEICFQDRNSDGFLVIYTPQGAADPVDTARAIVEQSKATSKPVITALMGEDDCWKARRILRRRGVPAFATPEHAVATFMYMYNYTGSLELLYETPEELSVEMSIPTFLKEVLRRAADEGRKILNLHESLQFLKTYKIPTIKTVFARTAGEAKKAASTIGYPIVIKAISPQITHKSKAEAVILNLWSERQVETSFNDLAAKIQELQPKAEFQGVAVQPMILSNRCEVLIGSKRDLHFGPVIAFGLGGTTVEIAGNVSIGFPPLNQVLARRLMENTAIQKFLDSQDCYASQKLLEEILVRFSQLLIDFPEIKEIDVNPIIVNENEATAVDARIIVDTRKRPRKHHHHEQLIIAPYPKKYVAEWRLKDGKSVTLRPIRPEDENLVYDLFQSLSEETMRFRFFQVIKDLSHQMLIRYCNIDYDREIAIVAQEEECDKRIIGISRLIMEPGRRRGEFAVVVGDQWQGFGLGSKLIDHIVEVGKDMGLETMSGDVLSANLKMIDLCVRKGFKMEPVDGETVKAVMKLP